MKDIQNSKKPLLTIEKIYGDFAILVFSIAALIISIFLLNNQPLTDPALRVYFGFGLFSSFFIGVGYLIAHFLAYYSLKTYDWVRKKWEIYKWFYWLGVLVIILGVLVCIAYNKLEKKTFWGLAFGMFSPAILTSIGWILVTKVFKKRVSSEKAKKETKKFNKNYF